MNSAQLLDLYAEILDLTRQMQECARSEQWDRLIELEKIRAATTNDLMKYESEALWQNAELEKKGDLIRSTLEMDVEISRLTQAWKSELQELLDSIDNAKKLSKAYDTP